MNAIHIALHKRAFGNMQTNNGSKLYNTDKASRHFFAA